MDVQDARAFRIAMQMLSSTFNIELTEMRFHTYWNALVEYPLGAIEWACLQAVKEEDHFPVPLTLREYAKFYREERRNEHIKATHLLAQRSESSDEAGLEALRTIRAMLGDGMVMTHPVYQEPSSDDPEQRRVELLAQARYVHEQVQTKGE